MRWWVLALLGACYEPSSLECSTRCDDTMACPAGLTCAAPGELCASPGRSCTAIDTDATPDPTTCDAGTVRVGTGAGLVRLCLPSIAPGTKTILDQIVDTDRTTDGCAIVNVDGEEACVLAFEDIVIRGALVAQGTRRLVVAATGTITIEDLATVSVASKTDPAGTADVIGAGAAVTCSTPGGSISLTGAGAGGGAGGRFANQLPGAGGASTQVTGASIAPVDIEPPRFRAGCEGGRGGASGNTIAGQGGRPGGAVYFLADTIVVDGTINASGAAGGRAPLHTGGNGGGSGGFIGFDAVTRIALGATAQIFALGGGGSTGGRADTFGDAGKHAAGPNAPADVTTGLCEDTAGQLTGGGGAGSSGTTDATAGLGPIGPELEIGRCGGGGGGGGSGRIMFIGSLTDTTIVAPALEPMPP